MRTNINQETQVYRPPPPPQKRPKTNKPNWTPWIIGGGMVFIGFSMVFAVIALIAVIYFSQPRIASGVSVAGLSVGGKSSEDAEKYLAQNLANPSITAADGDRRWLVTLADLGVTIDLDSTLKAAEIAASDAVIQPRY